PLDGDAGRLHNPDDGFGDLGPDAVAGNQRDCVSSHSRAYQARSISARTMLIAVGISESTPPAYVYRSTASITATVPARSGNRRGGGPTNFSTNSETSTTPPHTKPSTRV